MGDENNSKNNFSSKLKNAVNKPFGHSVANYPLLPENTLKTI